MKKSADGYGRINVSRIVNSPPERMHIRRETLFFTLFNGGGWITIETLDNNGFEIQGYT